MIHFSEIANPPTPVYRPMCVACDGRGVVPSLSRKSVQRCVQCNGTGKEGNTPEPAEEGSTVDAQWIADTIAKLLPAEEQA